jgi:hypothetical protein
MRIWTARYAESSWWPLFELRVRTGRLANPTPAVIEGLDACLPLSA